MWSYRSCMGQRTSSFPERKGACDGTKEVKDPMQGIFSVSASNETIDSADVGLWENGKKNQETSRTTPAYSTTILTSD